MDTGCPKIAIIKGQGVENRVVPFDVVHALIVRPMMRFLSDWTSLKARDGDGLQDVDWPTGTPRDDHLQHNHCHHALDDIRLNSMNGAPAFEKLPLYWTLTAHWSTANDRIKFICN